MLIKKDHSMQSVRAWQCTDHIDRLKKTFLSHFYIKGFIHDITYGKGQFSILTHDKAYLKYFYENQSPGVFTDESGRVLPDGIFFTHMLPLTDEQTGLLQKFTNTFETEYLLHIVKHEKNLQNTYSFMLHCNENQLLVFVANKLPQLRRFIAIYERQCKQDIEFVMSEKNHLVLPYSPGKVDEISVLLQSCLVDEEPCHDKDLLIPHALDNQLVKLTEQQGRCFQLLLQGRTAKDIAQAMNLSYRTIQHYTASIYERLGLESSRELIAHYVHFNSKRF
jgi:DNA-binding CsgD family transcriptional regulator